jgi:two-component system, NtrC family, sensor kinase
LLNIIARGPPLRLSTRLTIYLSLIIIIVLSGYGYFHILTRRDILERKMQVDVRSTGRTLKVALEKISLPREMEYVQQLIDAVEEYERTLGVIVYHQGKSLVFHSRSIEEGVEPYLELIRKSMQDDQTREDFAVFHGTSVFSHSFPLKDRTGKNIGGVAILQRTSFMEEEIQKAKWTIFVMIFLLISGTVILFLLGTRQWITQPISKLMQGIRAMSKGNLDVQIDLKRGDELSDLAAAFNQMAVELKKAQTKIQEEGIAKLELERNLRQSEKLATIGQLASELAHEIGTPLNIISGRAELMQKRLEDRDIAQKNLELILKQTERITKIIQQLLRYVRIKKPEKKPLNLDALIENTLDLLDYQFQKQSVQLEKAVPHDLPPVAGDPDQLQQVFINLMLNAFQSMPDGGLIRISASSKRISREGMADQEREFVEVSIKDAGIGIERDMIQNLFDPFFTTKEKGTGLGLTVSRGIVQDHEGWIEAESEIGKGSLFRIYLPTVPEEVAP